MSERLHGLVVLPDELVERAARRAADLVLEQLRQSESAHSSPYLSVAEAAELLRAKPQRVYDLVSSGRLRRFKDGARTLVERAELEAHLAGGAVNGVAHALPPSPRTHTVRRAAR